MLRESFKTTKLVLLIQAIEDYLDEYSYYDEELNRVMVNGTEQDMYEEIIRDKELQSFSPEVIRKWCSFGYNNWEV